jgi:hypothetical protein
MQATLSLSRSDLTVRFLSLNCGRCREDHSKSSNAVISKNTAEEGENDIWPDAK